MVILYKPCQTADIIVVAILIPALRAILTDISPETPEDGGSRLKTGRTESGIGCTVEQCVFKGPNGSAVTGIFGKNPAVPAELTVEKRTEAPKNARASGCRR